ncbi:MAG: hypothetical protein ACE5OR_10445 [bacterium]
MKTLGYFEGTDPIILTKLATKGIETLPLGNGADNHGKYVGHITKHDNISLIIGYLHKVLPLSEHKLKAGDILFSCKTHNIPVMLIVPKSDQVAAKNLLGNAAEYTILVDRDEIMDRVLQILG